MSTRPRSKFYAAAIKWIAENDDAGCLEAETIYLQRTVRLVAEIFDISGLTVTHEIIDARRAVFDAREAARNPNDHLDR